MDRELDLADLPSIPDESFYGDIRNLLHKIHELMFTEGFTHQQRRNGFLGLNFKFLCLGQYKLHFLQERYNQYYFTQPQVKAGVVGSRLAKNTCFTWCFNQAIQKLYYLIGKITMS